MTWLWVVIVLVVLLLIAGFMLRTPITKYLRMRQM